ncbi:MAG: cupin domain-containing protein [Promethearchaeota archaeon]|jgi:quercetin dioxygenase-like cupin family protein
MSKNIFENQKFLVDTPAKDLIYKSNNFKIMRISLKKGLVIPSHQGNHVVIFFVLKGRGLFISGSGEVELGENDYISLDANEPRGITSLEDLVVLAIRD